MMKYTLSIMMILAKMQPNIVKSTDMISPKKYPTNIQIFHIAPPLGFARGAIIPAPPLGFARGAIILAPAGRHNPSPQRGDIIPSPQRGDIIPAPAGRHHPSPQRGEKMSK